MRRTLPIALLGVVIASSVSLVAGTALADDVSVEKKAASPAAQTALMFDLSIGPTYSRTIGSAFAAGAGVHARYEFLQVGLTGSVAKGENGTYSAGGLEVGPVLRDVGGLDLGLFALGGRRKYGDVGAIAASHDFFGCSGMSGFDGATTYLGARLDMHRAVRKPRLNADMVGPTGLLGASIYYLQDTSSQQLARDGSISCPGLIGPPSESPRRVEATMGGYEIGVAFRFGFGAGF